MQDSILHLALIQTEIIWEDIGRNLEHLDDLINLQSVPADIVILPEMFTTGFSMNTEKLAEKPEGSTFRWMKRKAKERNSAIAGSIIIKDKQKYFNRLLWVNPDGSFFTYDKRHLFSIGGEDKYFERGSERLIVKYKNWRICPLICYDLRFPVWSRNNNAYDLLLYHANWPGARNQVWNILLRARAIENQCFVAGVNRVGRDGENIHYVGESCVVHPKGYLTAAVHEPVEQILNYSMSLNELKQFRTRFPVLKDGDNSQIQI
jgi:omega-amidase